MKYNKHIFPKIGIVYYFRNKNTNKYYVGSTTQKLSKRFFQHMHKTKNKTEKKFVEDYDNYGINSFEPPKELWKGSINSFSELWKIEAEFYHKFVNEGKILYNERGGNELTENNRKKFLEYSKQRKSEEWKQYMSEINSGKNNPMYGCKTSEKTKQKISESVKRTKATEKSKLKRINIKNSEEQKRKISETWKNKWKSLEYREYRKNLIQGINNPNIKPFIGENILFLQIRDATKFFKCGLKSVYTKLKDETNDSWRYISKKEYINLASKGYKEAKDFI